MRILADLYVFAVSKKLNKSKELDVYVYSNGRIYSYSPQWELDTSWTYQEKISEIALQADDEVLEWVDIRIKDGQEITRKGNNVYADDRMVKPFRKLTQDKFSTISPITTKLFNEFISSREKDEEELKGFIKETFDEGLFATQIADLVESSFQYSVESCDLNILDKQIIVRTKIEGHNFIVNFVKNILHSNVEEKIEFCEIFFGRVFMLESQNYIKL